LLDFTDATPRSYIHRINDDPRSLPELTRPFVLTVSRLLPYKNLEVVLAVASMRPDYDFVIVGDGPDYERLTSQAGRNVRILRGVSDGELRWLYTTAACLIAPSFEDFGLTPIEANLYGTPVAALRSGGYLDTVTPGVNGIFFERLSPSSVMHAIDGITSRGWNKATLAEAAARFSVERFSRRMRDICNEVREESPRG
jgi:glycosyltransferase involved in cell wall biosynthesis